MKGVLRGNMRVRVRDVDGVWVVRHINPKNLFKVFKRCGGFLIVL